MAARISIGSATIRPVIAQDGHRVREIILQMLSESPQAFGETLAQAQARTDEEWKQFIESMIAPPDHAAWIAFDKEGACGFVDGEANNPQTPPGTVLVSRLWVAPLQRGTGLGQRLMDSVTQWAVEQNAQQIGLGVTEMNTGAMKFYEHLGYTDMGIRMPIPWDPARQIIILGRGL